jgi:hypothetical protein
MLLTSASIDDPRTDITGITVESVWRPITKRKLPPVLVVARTKGVPPRKQPRIPRGTTQ